MSSSRWVDYYEILGVPFEATAEEIEKSYHCLMRKYHPDAGGGRAGEEKCKIITFAHSVLGNPLRRYEYDETYLIDKRDFGQRMKEKPKPPEPPKESKPPPKAEDSKQDDPPKKETRQPAAEQEINDNIKQEKASGKRQEAGGKAQSAEDQGPQTSKEIKIGAFRSVKNWFGRGSESEIFPGESFFRWLFASVFMIPQIIFCLPYIIYANIFPVDHGNLTGAYIFATVLGAPIARAISAFFENRRVRNLLVFPICFYIFTTIFILLIFKFMSSLPSP